VRLSVSGAVGVARS